MGAESCLWIFASGLLVVPEGSCQRLGPHFPFLAQTHWLLSPSQHYQEGPYKMESTHSPSRTLGFQTLLGIQSHTASTEVPAFQEGQGYGGDPGLHWRGAHGLCSLQVEFSFPCFRTPWALQIHSQTHTQA